MAAEGELGRPMIPWELLGVARVPGSKDELRLHRRGEELSIRVGGQELMNSRMHASEDALGSLPLARVAGRPGARVLIGGLGMGFTLAAALEVLAGDARVDVAELVPEVVAWNRAHLGHLAKRPLDDPRVSVIVGDVGDAIRAAKGAYDAILLDVDNGPEGLTRAGNDRLYGRQGLSAARAALRSDGVFAVWSARPDRAFTDRLARVGFAVEETRIRARGASGGAKHTLWIAAALSPRGA